MATHSSSTASSVIPSEPQASHARRREARAFMRHLGPAMLVSVGYMDPGNWATDLEGGARFGYDLLWVLLVSNAMALVLQTLSARLGCVSGRDLAARCRLHYPKPISLALWLLAELAIIACDLAEVLGSAVALNMLFGLPLLAGALITALDVFAIMALQRVQRRLELLVVALLCVVAVCIGVELVLAAPSPAALAPGLVPKLDSARLYVAIGILGATVMPHNLYLHSALVPHARPDAAAKQIKRSFFGTALALNLALIINAAILILAGAVFASRHLAVTELGDAQRLLSPLLGHAFASLLFAIGLLCAGQSASITGTLAGQIVMEGFLELRISPLLRRLVTRALAIVPAVVVLGWLGARGAMPLLIASQVVLSLQLPFAVVPLLRLTGSETIMRGYANKRAVQLGAVLCALAIIAANAALIMRTVANLRAAHPAAALLLAASALASLFLLAILSVTPLQHTRSD